MNMVVEVVKDKNYGKDNTKKLDRCRLYYLHTITFFFLFLSFDL